LSFRVRRVFGFGFGLGLGVAASSVGNWLVGR